MLSDQETLNAAFDKAIKGGWKGDKPIYDDHMDQWYVSDGDGGYVVPSITEIILSHDFCKALWGEDPRHSVTHSVEPNTSGLIGGRGLDNWMHHLQQLAISENRIKYLRENA